MGKYKVVSTVRARLREACGSDTQFTSLECGSAQLAKSCIKAAKNMLELFAKIDKVGKLTKSSFTDFQGCSVATMILLVAGIVERDICYDARVSFGLNCLRRMAVDNMAALTGVNFMEVLQSISEEAAKKLQSSGQVAQRSLEYPALFDPIPMNRDALTSGLPQATSAASLSWESMQPESTFSVPLSAGATWAQPTDPSYSSNGAFEGDFLWQSQFDNEAFLMGLTGLDALGISGS